MAMTGDQSPPAARVQVRIDDSRVRDAVAGHVMAIVAQTMRFLLLNPETWLSARITADERADVEQAVARLIGIRAADLTGEPCPLCQHTAQCAQGCPVEIARTMVDPPGRL
jgi:hypothetical protein